MTLLKSKSRKPGKIVLYRINFDLWIANLRILGSIGRLCFTMTVDKVSLGVAPKIHFVTREPV